MWGGNRLGGHAADTLNLGCCHDACLSSAFLTVVDAGDAFAPPHVCITVLHKIACSNVPLDNIQTIGAMQCNCKRRYTKMVQADFHLAPFSLLCYDIPATVYQTQGGYTCIIRHLQMVVKLCPVFATTSIVWQLYTAVLV